ncbi:ribonuclease H-like domain-containing protein [Chlamydoabsidia padenii]|nr:ribonuclease H-like domain-containing protein [Chlamydoabsidia padenii]
MILQRVNAHLSTLKVVELKELARSCGVLMYGTKPILTGRLQTHFEHLYQQSTTMVDMDRLLPPSVLSFDMGYRNLAFVHLTRQKHITAWHVTDLELNQFHPSAMVPVVNRFVQQHICPLLPTHTVIEQQRARSSSSHGIFEHTLRVNTIEALLWCTLAQVNDAPMEPILRQPVDKLWLLDENLLTLNKKKASVVLVKDWLEQGKVTCPDDLVDMFMTTKKKDDLSDALMQALAFYQWRENAIKYLATFMPPLD